jgi:hypothetical protein
MISLPLKQMSRAEKLMALVGRSEPQRGSFKSPAWHGREVAATSRRARAGKEKFVDFDAAKRRLRKKSR